MQTRLLRDQFWNDTITPLANKHANKALVAVGYFGKGGARRLPLKAGSVLIVDMSEGAVKSGQTCPAEIGKLLAKGVEVHSKDHLHAKVFVLGSRAIVGSSNNSERSSTTLVEAAIDTSVASVIDSCREFIGSLRVNPVTPTQAKAMQRLYRPPRIPGGSRKNGKSRRAASEPDGFLWWLPISTDRWTDADDLASDKGLPTAKKHQGSRRLYDIEVFSAPRSWLPSPLRDWSVTQRGRHVMVQAVREGQSTKVSPPGRLLHIQPYKTKHGHRIIGYIEVPRGVRPLRLKAVLDKIGTPAKKIKASTSVRRLRSTTLRRQIFDLWPKLTPKAS